MNSERNTARTSRRGGESASATPSIALLNRKLGTSPAPRMLTPSEIALLRQCAKEASEVAREIAANANAAKAMEGASVAASQPDLELRHRTGADRRA